MGARELLQPEGPGQTIEAVVNILHSFLLGEHGEHGAARELLRGELGSESITTPGDFMEAVRIWTAYKARCVVQA